MKGRKAMIGKTAVLIILSLVGAVGGYEVPSFLQYYQPYEVTIEPNAPGYELPLDMGSIMNYAQVNQYLDLDPVQPLLARNGFAVLEHEFVWFDPNRDDMIQPYAYLADREIPLYVSSDAWLHLYHVQFDETLRDIEEREFIPDLTALSAALQAQIEHTLMVARFGDPDWLEAYQRNLAYVSVARKLLEPDTEIPAAVHTQVERELVKIEAHVGFSASDIFIYEEDYSQYVPRGHYTRSAALERYFKAMMWYGRMAFMLKGSDNWGRLGEALVSVQDARIQTIQAVELAQILQNVQVGERSGLEIWDRFYQVTAFYVGLADDLIPHDYLWALEQAHTFWDLANGDYTLAVKAELAALPSPRIHGGTGDILIPEPITHESVNEVLDKTKGMRLMGQRFVPDSYMFQNLVFPAVVEHLGDHSEQPFSLGFDGGGFSRCYPRGLDAMAVLGSREALKILIDEGDTNYARFWQQYGQLQDEFQALTQEDWHANLYWSWLYALKALLVELPDGYPRFMRTAAWQRHQLHSALASWAQLRHDTILYAKQSYTSGRGGRPQTPPPGYVEPLPEFLGRLLTLNRMTRMGLADLDVLSPEATRRLQTLEDLLQSTLGLAEKQLLNEVLSEADALFIKGLAGQLQEAVTGVDRVGLKTTLVADVHTHTVEKTVVEEATGKVDLIVVACPGPNGSVFLAVGPVLSYYEFKHPMSDRMTDEAWRDMLGSDQRPERPKWYAPLMTP
jgi:hypothetical protein